MTFDNRGRSPDDDTGDFTLADRVGDTVAVIEYPGFARCRLMGFRSVLHDKQATIMPSICREFLSLSG